MIRWLKYNWLKLLTFVAALFGYLYITRDTALEKDETQTVEFDTENSKEVQDELNQSRDDLSNLP